MEKRGQVTTYVLLGILILFVAIGALYIRPSLTQEVKDVSRQSQTENVKGYVYACIQETLPAGLFLIGAQGGYLNVQPNSVQTETINVAYGSVQGKNTLPSTTHIESEISTYIEEYLPLCTEFSRFQGVTITPEGVEAQTTITNDNIRVKVRYPLTMRKDQQTTTLRDEYEVTVPIRLSKIINVANTVVAQHLKHKEVIDVNALLETDMDVSIIEEQEAIIYAITDQQSVIKNTPYTFMFANEI